jgi:carboxylesterase type B
MNIATNLYILSIAFGLFLIASVKAEDFQPKLPLYYNTTSGIYRAELVSVVSHRTKYVAKLSYIPYAEKPGRFQHSVLKKYEHNVKQSDENIVCHQAAELNMYGLFKIRDIGRKTEDCLRITIYIPLSKEQPKNLSVVIHIHGGSNYVGSSGLFDGSIVSAHGNVIVAIINYRLGMLGFLSDGTKKYPGNFGLRDQVNALKWLKLNCPTLGCNPNSITLWGKNNFCFSVLRAYLETITFIA